MSKRKLLLADDSVTIQKVVNLTFADEGIEVISVGDGDSAMEKIAEISPDLIMADVHMPGLNGYEICERIRNDESLRSIPVILLVGSFEPFDEAEAKRVGADDFLTKPFQSIRQLVNKVTALLNSSESADLRSTGDLSSFTETLEIAKSETTEFSPITDPPEYDIAMQDDEMIETVEAPVLPIDSEVEQMNDSAMEADFYAEETSDDSISAAADETLESLETSDSQGTTAELETEQVYERVSDEDADSPKGFDFVANDDELLNEEYLSDEISKSVDSENTDSHELGEAKLLEENEDADELGFDDELPLPEAASILQIDEDNLLELPPIESDFEDEGYPEEVGHVAAATAGVGSSAAFASIGTIPEAKTSVSSAVISDDLIEEIVQRVIARLSDTAVKEIAWEVVPPMTELIVKKMAEEKLKD